MFTSDAQAIIDQAKDVAVSRGEDSLTIRSVATSVAMDRRSVRLFAECLSVGEPEVRGFFPPPGSMRRCPGKLALSAEVRDLLAFAKELVGKVPLPSHPSLIAIPHLVCGVTKFLPKEELRGIALPDEARLLALLAGWVEERSQPASLGELTRQLRALRSELFRRVHGQDHAIQQFIDGIFNAEVVAAADTERRKPCGLFVFAGPPGVGKTYLAELAASHLDRPFMRFDMSAYAHGHEAVGLTGIPRMYQGAKVGPLTDFVQRNPNALLLFDEIEKAHITAIHLFLQMLDAGRLQDKFTEETVEFRDTIVIFTTNAGRSLYDNANTSGVHQANAAFHRNTILDALRTEVDPRTREPFFPAAICSRLAAGYPILFNHLRVHDLVQIAEGELARVGALLHRRHGQRYRVAEEIPLAIVMREGAQTDARTVKAQADAFLKEEVFKACQLFSDERVDAALEGITEVSVEIDSEYAGEVADQLFHSKATPKVLFIGDWLMGELVSKVVPEVEWSVATNKDQAFDFLAKGDIDVALLDLALKPKASSPGGELNDAFWDISGKPAPDKTVLPFDHSPLSARRYAAGQQLLEQLHARMPETPVFLFAPQGGAGGIAIGGLDEELLLACVRAGGARGAVRPALVGRPPEEWGADLLAELQTIATRLRMERHAAELARQSQVVAFDTAPEMAGGAGHLRIRCRNFRMARAIRSTDASALVSDVERPTTRFADVIGATGAKEALAFIRDWLRDPKKYAAAGIDPPRGVLLSGAPGTGKTMLARALAGESDCAFLVESGTNFVTIWQGSGPENIRNLFTRARRYAPSIVFIDEIDAIGGTRAASAPGSAGHGERMALNALLTEMDGFAKGAARPVVVLAATNHPEQLDPALLRRFSRVIDVELPTRSERELYLTTRLQAKAKHNVSPQMIERLAAQGAGLSIADLERILAQASVSALANEGIIDDEILGEAFEKVTMGEAKAGSDSLRTARHEAGHALLMCLTGQVPIYVTIVGRGSFGGYAAFEDRDERRSFTRPELEGRLCQILGGREAERLYYGAGEGDSTGPLSDLERATGLAEAMVYEYGMAPEVGFVRIDRHRPISEELAARCHVAVRRILEEQATRAASVLAENRERLDRIVDALMERNRLLKDELLSLINPADPTDAGEVRTP